MTKWVKDTEISHMTLPSFDSSIHISIPFPPQKFNLM